MLEPRPILGLVTALSLTGVLAACGGGDRPDRAQTVSEEHDRTARADGTTDTATTAVATESSIDDVPADASALLTKAQARAALPGVTDLPTGWTTDPDKVAGREGDDNSDSTYKPARCKQVFEPLDDIDGDRVARAEATFRKSQLGPYLAVTISSYADDVPSETFDTVVAAFDDCPTFSVTDDTGTARFAASPVSFPNLGDDTVALRFAASQDGTHVEVEVASVRLGHNVVSVTQLALTDVNSRVTEKAARATLAKIGAT